MYPAHTPRPLCQTQLTHNATWTSPELVRFSSNAAVTILMTKLTWPNFKIWLQNVRSHRISYSKNFTWTFAITFFTQQNLPSANVDLTKTDNEPPVTPSNIQVRKAPRKSRAKSPVSKEELLRKHRYIGNIRYHNLDASEYSSKYVVVDKNETADTLVKRIFNNSKNGWFKTQMPKLIISVTGSAQNFQMKPNLKSVFRRGIAQAAKSTG